MRTHMVLTNNKNGFFKIVVCLFPEISETAEPIYCTHTVYHNIIKVKITN